MKSSIAEKARHIVFAGVLTLALAFGFMIASMAAPAANETGSSWGIESAQAASYKLNKKSITLKRGSDTNIWMDGTSAAQDKKIKWSSSNTRVAKVKKYKNSNGYYQCKVTGVGIGTCTVKAVWKGKTYKCKVTVKSAYEMSTTFGAVSGNVTYHYNQYKGYVPDTGALVYLISRSGSAADYKGDLRFGSQNEMAKYGLYRTTADGNGNFTFNHVATGDYYIVFISQHSNNGAWFDNAEQYKSDIIDCYDAILGVENAGKLADIISYNRHYWNDWFTVYKNETSTQSHAFPYTYV